MYTLEKQRSVSVRDSDKSHVKVNGKKEALQKLAQYLRDERDYSENEIRKFMAESFVGKVDY
ncbi:MAG TPA: hypothetical protein ENI23_00895 [bacterium]|nr:hypothetical protein [bacterium]